MTGALTVAGVVVIAVASATDWNLIVLLAGVGLLWAGLAL